MTLEKVLVVTILFYFLAKHVSSVHSDENIEKILQELNVFKQKALKDIEWLKQENVNLLGKNNDLVQKISKMAQENDILKIKSNSMYEAPIGAIVAWTPKPDKDTLNPTSLPSGWVFCDGSKIEGGIWDGRTTPNLNGERRFLRGGNENDVLKLEDEETNYRDIYFLPDFTHDNGDRGHAFSCSDYGGEELFALEIESLDDNPDDFLCERKGGDENRPKNMNILWIMKVK